jgi:hypothetical protein
MQQSVQLRTRDEPGAPFLLRTEATCNACQELAEARGGLTKLREKDIRIPPLIIDLESLSVPSFETTNFTTDLVELQTRTEDHDDLRYPSTLPLL